MKVFGIIVGHIAVCAVLLGLGLWMDGKSDTFTKNHPGVIFVFSITFSCYATFLNFWYHKSPKFHFTVNRILLWFARTHTYWQPHFDLRLAGDMDTAALAQCWELLKSGRYGQPVKKEETPTTFCASLDNLLVMKFRVADCSLFVSFDHKLLVPSHLYDAYRQRLGRLVEDLVRAVNAMSTRCGIIVEFAEGKRNPYYGFFINRIPPSLLDDFQVTFRLDAASDCRIEAGQNRINIEGTRLTEVFDALAQVLALRTLPSGDTQ
jgi:hypothetical protein